MARPNIPSGVVRVAVEGHTGAHTWVNTFWLATTGTTPPSAAQVNGLAHGFMAAFNALWAPGGDGNAATEQTICQWNDGAGGIVDGTDATPVSGENATAPAPASIAFVLSWRLPIRYRGGHPRTYLAGQWRGNYTDPTQWATSYVASQQTLANTFLATINGLTPSGFTSVTLGCLRQFANGGSETNPPTYLTPPVFHAFGSVIAKPGLGSQRRRFGDNFA